MGRLIWIVVLLISISTAPVLADRITSPSKLGNGELLSLDLQDADIQSTLRMLAEMRKINLVIDRAVSGQISIHLKDVTWEQAFQTILSLKGLRALQLDTVYYVTSLR